MSIGLINSILFEHFNSIIIICIGDNILNYDLICDLISKKDIIYWWNIYNFICYLFYKSIHTFLINLYFYIIQFFLIFIYNNMPNKFVQNGIYFIVYQKHKWVVWLKQYFSPLRFRRLRNMSVKLYGYSLIIFKFYYIDYLRILYILLFIYIFYIMWKKRRTYRKLTFVKNGLKFYFLAVFFSSLFVYLFGNTFLSIFTSLILSFFLIWLTLN